MASSGLQSENDISNNLPKLLASSPSQYSSDSDSGAEETKKWQKRRASINRGTNAGVKKAKSTDDERASTSRDVIRSRLSAKECRARKKLRYQYLEELITACEQVVLNMRAELKKVREMDLQKNTKYIIVALYFNQMKENSLRNSAAYGTNPGKPSYHVICNGISLVKKN